MKAIFHFHKILPYLVILLLFANLGWLPPAHNSANFSTKHAMAAASNLIFSQFAPSLSNQNTPTYPLGSQLNFSLLSPGQGWLHTSRQLFWTVDNGLSWRELTPDLAPDQSIQTVSFLGPDLGWVVLYSPSKDALAYTIASTRDGGETWSPTGFTALEHGMTTQPVSQVSMQWLDANSGFILFKLLSGNQFSLGKLFSTQDGGQTWTARNAPIGDEFHFPASQIGFMAGGPGDDQLYRSTDAGRSWQEIGSGLKDKGVSDDARYALPAFISSGYGMLALIDTIHDYEPAPIVLADQAHANQAPANQAPTTQGQRLLLFESFDWGATWFKRAELPLQPGRHYPTPPLLQLVNRDNFHVSLDKFLWSLNPGQTEMQFTSLDYDDSQLQNLKMTGENFGWGLFVRNTCTPEQTSDQESSINCSLSSKLVFTNNNGASWQPLQLPPLQIPLEQFRKFEAKIIPTAPDLDLPAKTQVFIGQGFDKCEIPSLEEMQTWWTSSPYKTINLYIGGISRYCDNEALTADYVAQMALQGWRFFPTWVGPQAPCSGYRNKISADPALAYNEGIDNANQAVSALQNLGLTLEDGSGSVVYYDLEAYTGDAECNAAVGAFLDGWSMRLHQLGNLSGLYGSACGSYLYEYFELTNPPDVIWPAIWFSDYFYDPEASVWGLKCIPDYVYDDHQRIRQYTGGHVETWGDVSMSIDCDVLDGVVAQTGIQDLLPPITTLSLEGRMGSAGWYTSSVTVTLTASDDLSGISALQYNLDGYGWVEYSTPFTILGEGYHNLQYQSIDLSGNMETVQTVSIKIDSIAPANPVLLGTGCTTPDNTWQNNCNDPAFTWSSALDATSGLDGYEVYWGSDPNGSEGILTHDSAFDPAPVPDGIQYLRVRTRDLAGNWSAYTRLYTLRYDGSLPQGVVTLHHGWPGTSQVLVEMQHQASDSGSGVAYLRIRDMGGDWTGWQAYQEFTQWILPAVTAQNHTIEVQYQDLAGNLSLLAADSIFLDIYPGILTSQGFILKESSFDLAATHAQSPGFRLQGSLEQLSTVGLIESQDHQVYSGFWSWVSWMAGILTQYLPLIIK